MQQEVSAKSDRHLSKVIKIDEARIQTHLDPVLTDYIDNYYNIARTHMSLNNDSPVPRPVQPHGKIINKPILGGLHHVYTSVA